MSESSPSTSSGDAYWGGPTDSASAYKIRQAKIVASSKSTADKGKSLRAMKKEASARGEKWTPGIPEVKVPETRDATAAPRAPGAVYGGVATDSAYKIRQAKIMASKSGTADKGKALRAGAKAGAATGAAWTPSRSMDALDMPEVEELAISEPTATSEPKKKPGAVYGGVAQDSAYAIRQAKILASDKPTADKGAALRAGAKAGAAKGEAWTPGRSMDALDEAPALSHDAEDAVIGRSTDALDA